MKRKCNHKRNRGLRAAAIVLAGAAAMLTSCTDEELYKSRQEDGSLRFAVTEELPWQAGTRAAAGGTPQQATVKMNGETGGSPLYLHMSSQPGIETDDATLPALTRGNPDLEDDEHANFGLYAYAYTGSFEAAKCQLNYFYDVQVDRQSNDPDNEQFKIYKPADELFLPGTDNLMLFALMPRKPFIRNNGNMKPGKDATGIPEFYYQCPHFSTNQEDICLIRGTEVAAGAKGEIPLTFAHVLTRIQVVADKDMSPGTIRHLSFAGVRGIGYFSPAIGTTGDAGTWRYTQSEDNLGVIYYAYDHDQGTNQMQVEVGNGQDVLVTEGKTTFYMMPQMLGEHALLEINFLPQGETRAVTLTAELSGLEWKMGHTVTYRISHKEANDQVLEIYEENGTDLAQNKTVNFAATNSPKFKVKSLRNGTEAVDYSLQFSTDGLSFETNTDDTRPFIILNTPKSAVSGQTGWWNHTVTVRSGSNTVNGEDAKTLRNAGWKSNMGLLNTESANCYMVNAAGTYKFRAVYGNTIKNNANNTAVLGKPEYVDGRGAVIATPDLQDKYPNFEVKLIWQDVDGLITNVAKNTSEEDGKARITFTVGGSPSTYTNIIQPGNALIGAYTQDGGLIWSWHIWVTPPVGDGTVNDGISFLKYPIGFVRGGQMPAVEAETVYMRAVAKSKDGADVYSNVVTIKREGSAAKTLYGRYPTFQWGRKDPMWPSSPTYAQEGSRGAPLYDEEGATVTFNTGNLDPTLGGYVSSPTTFDNQAGNIDGNLWNAAGSGTIEGGSAQSGVVTKTPYDPSPAGYHVPKGDAFKACLTKDRLRVADFGTLPNHLQGFKQYDNDVTHQITIGSGNLILPLSGARSSDDANFNLLATSYGYNYGGSWTAARTDKGGTAYSELCFYAFIVTPGLVTINFTPGLIAAKSTGNSAANYASTWCNPLYCWPLISQKD